MVENINLEPIRFWVEVGDQTLLTHEIWYSNQILNRNESDGPAYQKWEVVGQSTILVEIGWYCKGELERHYGPAYQKWNLIRDHESSPSFRKILVEEYWGVDGQKHRLDGPASQFRDEHNQLVEHWYVRGVRVSPNYLRQPAQKIAQWWL